VQVGARQSEPKDLNQLVAAAGRVCGVRLSEHHAAAPARDAWPPGSVLCGPALTHQLTPLQRVMMVSSSTQKLNVAALRLIASCMTLAPVMITPSIRLSCVCPRLFAQGVHAHNVPPPGHESRAACCRG